MPKHAALEKIIERAASWPTHAQQQLAEVASEIEAELSEGTYRATADELIGIRRGLRAAADERFASDEEVEEVLGERRHR